MYQVFDWLSRLVSPSYDLMRTQADAIKSSKAYNDRIEKISGNYIDNMIQNNSKSFFGGLFSFENKFLVLLLALGLGYFFINKK